jgi:hypothetical protein
VERTTLLSFASPKESNKPACRTQAARVAGREKGTTKKALLRACFRVLPHSRRARAFRGRQPHLSLTIFPFSFIAVTNAFAFLEFSRKTVDQETAMPSISFHCPGDKGHPIQDGEVE